MSGQDADLIRHALITAKQQGFRHVRLQVGDTMFRAVLEEVTVMEEEDSASADAELLEVGPGVAHHEIKAPCVGYFEPSGLSIETELEAGQSVGVIRALGITNEVTTSRGGEVIEVLAQTGDAVEYGQVLARVAVHP